MKIYTKGGDRGETALFGGARVSKDEARVEAYGTVDELNACLGVVRATPELPAALDIQLERVQALLFVLGAELACQPGHEAKLRMPLIGNAEVGALEASIDDMQQHLPALKQFVLPGGSQPAALLHAARTVCRRAERRVVACARHSTLRTEPVIYLNRLSDWLFVAARWANHHIGVPDVPWAPPRGAS